MLRSETVRAAALGVPAQCGGRGSSCSLVTCQRPLGLEHVPALETRPPPPPPVARLCLCLCGSPHGCCFSSGC